MSLLSASEIPPMRRAGAAAAATLARVGAALRPGMTTAEIDRLVRRDTARRGGRCSQLGYRSSGGPPFPASVCTSVNHVVCHGIPRTTQVLRDGDIVNVDVTTELDGWHGDCSETFFVGRPSLEARHVVETARRCRDAGIAAIRPGAHLGDIGAAILALATAEGCSVVREFGGHGIGRRMHLDPHVHHAAERGSGPVLRVGMAFTVEPMINLGSAELRILDDGWTVVSADGSLSAQWEHTVVVTDDGAEILTRQGSGSV